MRDLFGSNSHFFYRVLGMPFANAATTDSSSAGFFLPEINECQVSFLQAHIVSAHDFFLCSTPHKPLKKCLYSDRILYNYIFIIFLFGTSFFNYYEFYFLWKKKFQGAQSALIFLFHDGWPSLQPWQFFFFHFVTNIW